MPKIQQTILVFIFLLAVVSCKEGEKKSSAREPESGDRVLVKYSKGFEITNYKDYKEITLLNPWPGSTHSFKYALVRAGNTPANPEKYDAIVEVPVKRLVVTSTTHIPSLEALEEIAALIGFPDLGYISSEKARAHIAEGKVTELGKNEDINTEILLELSPDIVVGFAVDGKNSTLTTLQKAGIPVLYNSDWTETSPLGKAEWIKFFGALFNKEQLADSLFAAVEADYLSAREVANQAQNIPTVISGAMYKDIWYMPEGDSWGAKFIKDANGDYLWKDSKGTGSLSLSLESVLEKGNNADIWIGPGQFTTLEEMINASKVYGQFKAFKNGEVYTYNLKKGSTGGSIYFELAPNRPDLVLKDMIKILHPELLPEHQLYFFSKLK